MYRYIFICTCINIYVYMSYMYRHTPFYCALQILHFFFLTLHQASLSLPISNSIFSLNISVSHFSKSQNISNVFIIIIFLGDL